MELKVLRDPGMESREEECEGCGGGSRRDFLEHAAGLLAGAFVSLGLSPGLARALPVGSATPLREVGSEVTLLIPAQDGAAIYKEQNLILARHAGGVYAFSLACPHQRTALRWLDQQGRFQCPKHKSKYRPDGAFISGRATRSMDRFPLRLEGSNVVVNTSRVLREDKDRAAWAEAVVRIGQK